jgi:predicted  nucleic acid-binding Zn-ribbon protein
MTLSTRDAILAMRKEKSTMECFESLEPEVSTTTKSTHTSTRSPLTFRRSDDVVALELRPQLAFAKFAGKIFDSPLTTNINSSSSATGSTNNNLANIKHVQQHMQNISFNNNIINVFPTQSSINTSSSSNSSTNITFEAPIEKFNRLRNEIQQFQNDLKQFVHSDEQKSTNTSDENTSVKRILNSDDELIGEFVTYLSTELEQLDNQLTHISNEKDLRSLLVTNQAENLNVSGTDLKKLTSDAGSLIQATSSSSTPSTNVTTTTHTSAATSANLHLSLLSALDRRLAAIEKIVGLPSSVVQTAAKGSNTNTYPSKTAGRGTLDNLSIWSTSVATFPDFYTALTSLHRKMSLLDASKLEGLHRTIKAIISDLELIESNKSSTGDLTTQSSSVAATPPSGAQKTFSSTAPTTSALSMPSVDQQRISELYETVSRWDYVVQQLPLLTQRFLSLKALHESTADAFRRLHLLETEQQKLQQSIQNDQQSLSQLSQSWTQNLAQIDNNLNAFSERIAKLQAKIK